MDLRKIFFRVYEKHLFITTCIEKQCTQPLSVAFRKLIIIPMVKNIPQLSFLVEHIYIPIYKITYFQHALQH